MKEKITGSLIWENAMRAGLILGGISVAYELLSLLPGLVGGFFGAVLSGVLFLVRIAKIVAIILLLKRMMFALTETYEGVTRREARRFGFEATLLSSLIVAGFSLISVIYLTPGLATTFSEALHESLSSMNTIPDVPDLKAQVEAQAAWFVRNFNVLVFVTSFIYCALWGVILTLIQTGRFDAPSPFDKP